MNVAKVALAALAVSLTAACGGGDGAGRDNRSAVFVGGDPTAIGRAWLGSNVRDDLTQVVSRCAQEHCTLYLDRVAESSAARAQRQVVDFVVPDELRSDPDAGDAVLAVLSVKAIAAAEAVFSPVRDVACTDLVGAISSAADALRGPPGIARRLVLFSGGFQTCPPNLLTAEATDTGVGQLIEQLRAARLLPDLRGVQVWMAGAGRVVDTEVAPPPERVEWLKQFWAAYFQAAGAQLVAWGPRLDRYPS